MGSGWAADISNTRSNNLRHARHAHSVGTRYCYGSNENADPDVASDMEAFSDELVPQNNRFRHSEGNSDAHIKASFYGSSVQVILCNGSLWLGTWQGIYFCEFDGPRERNVYLAFT